MVIKINKKYNRTNLMELSLTELMYLNCYIALISTVSSQSNITIKDSDRNYALWLFA